MGWGGMGAGEGREGGGVTQQANGTDNIILVSYVLQPQAHEDTSSTFFFLYRQTSAVIVRRSL